MSESSSESAPLVTRESLLRLMDQRKELEAELATWLSVQASQGVADGEPLVDSEGFPRNDIDVMQVRTARNKIVCIRNDLKGLMEQIEKGLHSLHQQAREGLDSSSATAMELDRVEELPMAFAKIDIVSDGSPAQSAGLRVGDLMVQFGSVTADNFTNLQALAEVAAHSKDSSLSVRVIRAGSVKSVTLKPRQWSGRGLIGCNIVPIVPEAVPDR